MAHSSALRSLRWWRNWRATEGASSFRMAKGGGCAQSDSSTSLAGNPTPAWKPCSNDDRRGRLPDAESIPRRMRAVALSVSFRPDGNMVRSDGVTTALALLLLAGTAHAQTVAQMK